MITDIVSVTSGPEKMITTNYGTWKQEQDTICITSATGIGKNTIQKFLVNKDKQYLTSFSTGAAIDTSKKFRYNYHPGAESPFDLQKKIQLKVYNEGHL